MDPFHPIASELRSLRMRLMGARGGRSGARVLRMVERFLEDNVKKPSKKIPSL